jgi:hypothetical protein
MTRSTSLATKSPLVAEPGGSSVRQLAQLLAVVILVVLPMVVSADTITVTGSGSRIGTGTFTVPVAQFNPGGNAPVGATLDNITITGTVSVTGSHSFENLDAVRNTFRESHFASVLMNLPGASPFIPDTFLSITDPPAAGMGTLEPFDGVQDFSGPDTLSFSGLSATSTPWTLTLSPSSPDFASFLGSGNALFGASATNGSNFGATGNVVSQFITNESGEVSVTYSYTPPSGGGGTGVPEPASLLLLVLGLGGIGVYGRYLRRKASRAV